MRRIRLTVAYDGTNYCGWQIQPNGITIEEVLIQGIRKTFCRYPAFRVKHSNIYSCMNPGIRPARPYHLNLFSGELTDCLIQHFRKIL